MKADRLTKRGVLIGVICIALSAAGSVVEASGAVEKHELAAELIATASGSAARESARTVNLALTADDVIPTGNDWIALPSIRASDGALQNFNVISMRYRGLLEVAGVAQRPLMAPFLEISGVRRPLAHLQWSLRDYSDSDRGDGSRRRARATDLCRPS